MAIPTVASVTALARSHLGDTAVAGGEVYTDTILIPFVAQATRELFRTLQNLQLPRVKVQAFYNLPANTSVLYPATAGITDMGEPLLVEERSVGGAYAVSGCAITSFVPTLVTATHPLSTGAWAVVWGIVGVTGASGAFTVTCADTTHVTLNGAYAVGTYSSGGYVSYSADEFTRLDWVDSIHAVEGTLPESLADVAWLGDSFRFSGASAARQLRITYWSSAHTVTTGTDSIGVDDSVDFLAVRTAGLAAASLGAKSSAQDLNFQALGHSGQADASGGLLRDLLVAAVLREQAERPIRRQPFRAKRAVYPPID